MNVIIKPKNYNEATFGMSWFEDSMQESLTLSEKHVKPYSTFIDFGAGTGNSTLRILNKYKDYRKMYVVDNSKSWLSKAVDTLKDYNNIDYIQSDEYSLMKIGIEKNTIDYIFSTNTVHLIKDFKKLARDFYLLLTNKGVINLSSGNIKGGDNSRLLLFDHATESIHGICIGLLCEKGIYFNDKKTIDEMKLQRKFVFPEARDRSYYINALYQVGFKHINCYNKKIKIYYSDWKKLLLLNRLQRGILPEIEDVIFREKLINVGIDMYFDILKNTIPGSNNLYFEIQYTFIQARK